MITLREGATILSFRKIVVSVLILEQCNQYPSEFVHGMRLSFTENINSENMERLER